MACWVACLGTVLMFWDLELLFHYSAAGGGAEFCDDRVCCSVYLFAIISQKPRTCPNCTKYSAHIACGSVHLAFLFTFLQDTYINLKKLL